MMLYRNSKRFIFPLIIKIITTILTIAFFAQDIAWANPDSLVPAKLSHANTLAAEFFSRDEPSKAKAIVRGTDELILKIAEALSEKTQDELSLRNIKRAVIFLEKKAGWFRDSNIVCQTGEEEVVVNFPQGCSLRYFTFNPQLPNIKKDAQGRTITTKLISRKTLLYKQLLEAAEAKLAEPPKALTAPVAVQTRERKQYPYADWSAVKRIVPDIVRGGGVARPRLVTREKEIALFEEAQKGNSAARDVLIEVNIALVRFIANKFIKADKVRALGISYEDLFSVGLSGYMSRKGGLNGGLVKAIDLFDPGRGFKFSTYAYRVVRSSMIRYIERVSKETHNTEADYLDLWQRASEIEGSNKKAQEVDRKAELIDFIFNEIAPRVLNQREREIIRDYHALRRTPGSPLEEEAWRIPKKYREIAEEQGVTKQRIDQMRSAALQKLRNAIPSQIIKEFGLAGLDLIGLEGDGPERVAPSSPAQDAGMAPEGAVMELTATHALHMPLVETEPVSSERRILLSANLFRPADGDLIDGQIEETQNRLALEAVLNKANISILEPDEMRKQVVKNNINRNNLTIVMTDTDYESGKILNSSEKTSWTRSGVLILRDRLTGANYLYLEGVIALAKAMMRDDELAVKRFYQILTGQVLSSEILNIARKDPIAFAVKTMLKFKPITPKDTDDLDRSRKQMETYLVLA